MANIDRILGMTKSDVRTAATMVASAFLSGLTYADKYEMVDERFIDHYIEYRLAVFELDQKPMEIMSAYKAFQTLVVDNEKLSNYKPPCLTDTAS